MITIFNRRELCVVFGVQEQAKVRKLLAENQIDYSVKTTNRMSPSPMADGSRSRVGTLGHDVDAMYEYKFYVHKADYEKAKTFV